MPKAPQGRPSESHGATLPHLVSYRAENYLARPSGFGSDTPYNLHVCYSGYLISLPIIFSNTILKKDLCVYPLPTPPPTLGEEVQNVMCVVYFRKERDADGISAPSGSKKYAMQSPHWLISSSEDVTVCQELQRVA